MQTGNPFGKRARAAATVLVVLAVTGSAALSVASAQETAHTRDAREVRADKGPFGLWRTDGYGTVLSVGRDRVREYRTSGVSCLKGASAKRAGGHGRTARYITGDGTAFTLRSAAGSPKHASMRASMRWEQSPGHRELRRIGSLPEACGRTGPKDPVAAFDVFAELPDGQRWGGHGLALRAR